MDREDINGGRLTPEERQERVRKLKRKRRFRLAIVIGGFVLAFCLLVSPVLLFAVFRIDTFIVEGETLYSDKEIVAASGIQEGKSLFFADLDEAKVGIETKLPYTNNVKITRKLPNKIIIRLESTDKAYAIEKSEGLYAITNRDFKVLEISGVIPENVVPVIGATPKTAEPGKPLSFVDGGEKTDATLALIRSISTAIADEKLEDVNLVSIRSRSNVYLIYQERIVMRLGDSSDAAKKIELGKSAIESQDKLDGVQVGVINLTVAKKAYFKPSDIKDIPEFEEYEAYVMNKEKDSDVEAYAIESKNGSYAIVNKSFKVIDFASTAPEGIIPIEGFVPDEASVGSFLEFGDETETEEAYETIRDVYEAVTDGEAVINLIGFDDDEIYVICNELVVFRLGSSKNIENKLAKGKKLLDKEDEGAIGVVELSDIDNAFFDETAYDDIPELMDYNPDYIEESEDDE